MRILGVSGSLRAKSYNTGLLEEARKLLPRDVTMEIADIANLPLYGTDKESDPPESVRMLKAKIKEANAILFATPEYNRSISAALKNAIEWGNHPESDNSWDGKPAAIISASTGPRGGVRSQLQLRQICVDLNVYAMNGPELFLGNAQQAFDSNLNLIDETARIRLRSVIEGLVAWAARFERGRN
jgi:chromate reductase